MHFFLTEINILGIVTIENGEMVLKMVQQFDLAKICFDRSDINKFPGNRYCFETLYLFL